MHMKIIDKTLYVYVSENHPMRLPDPLGSYGDYVDVANSIDVEVASISLNHLTGIYQILSTYLNKEQ